MTTEQHFQQAINEVWYQYQEEKKRLRTYEEKVRTGMRAKIKAAEESGREDSRIEIEMLQGIVNSQRHSLKQRLGPLDMIFPCLISLIIGFAIGYNAP